MALQQQFFYVGAFNDSLANGNNYVSGQVYQVFNTNDTLAPIFSDAAGTSPINQDGISNISNTDGGVEFYITSGNYYLKVGVKTIYFDTSNINNLSQAYIFETVADYQASTIDFKTGKTIYLNDRGSSFKIIDGVLSANSYNIIANSNTGKSASLIFEKVLFPQHFGCIGDGVSDDSPAFIALIGELQHGYTINFDGYLCRFTSFLQIIRDLNDITLTGGGGAVRVGNDFTDPLISFQNCNNITIDGLLITGTDENITQFLSGDYGIRFRSCSRIKVTNNTFSKFADSALTISTISGGSTQTESFDCVVTGNIFDRVWQTSTTGNSGGANKYIFSNNICNVYGAIKFASRTDDAQNLIISNNIITSILAGEASTCELVGFTYIEVNGNIIQGFTDLDYDTNIGINLYTNDLSETLDSPLSNINIINNTIKNHRRSIRYSPTPVAGSNIAYDHIKINNNNIECRDVFVSLVKSPDTILIKNNVIFFDGVSTATFLSGCVSSQDSSNMKLDFSNNRITNNTGLAYSCINLTQAAEYESIIFSHNTIFDMNLVTGNAVTTSGLLCYIGHNVATSTYLPCYSEPSSPQRNVIENNFITCNGAYESFYIGGGECFFSGNVIKNANASQRVVRIDYGCTTFDGGGNHSYGSTVAYFGGVTDTSGVQPHII